jgi:hypothetical protein
MEQDTNVGELERRYIRLIDPGAVPEYGGFRDVERVFGLKQTDT